MKKNETEMTPEQKEYMEVAKEVEELLNSKGYALQPYSEPKVRLVKLPSGAEEETKNEDN